MRSRSYILKQSGESQAAVAQRPRYHLHFTPTYALNQVERWFGFVTETALRRGSYVGHLVKCIKQFIEDYNAAPFAWAATAEVILEKVQRSSMRIPETEH